jgi:glucan phosphoethanolaminetransferase (alkaline phosphatase superfamily)
LRRWHSIVLLWVLVVLVPDLYVRGPRLNGVAVYGRVSIAFYFAALGASLCLWLAVGAWLSRLRVRWPYAAWGPMVVAAVVLATWAVGVLGYRANFGLDPRPIVWAYLVDNPKYTLALLAASVTPFLRAAVLGTPLVALVVIAHATKQPFAPLQRAWQARAVVLGSLLLLACYWLPARRMKLMAAPPDMRGLHTFLMGTRQWLSQADMPTLPVAQRVRLPPQAPERRPDIVLIVHESLGKTLVSPWNGKPAQVTPRVAAFLEEHAAHTAWFAHAMTVAPVTNVALPALLTGLSAETARSDYARAPLIWEEAQARGYASAFYSAEDFNVSFFRAFFLKDSQLDEWKTAPEFVGKPRVNDSGIEDSIAVDAAVAFIARTPKDRPLFLVLQFNATHWPCWAPSLRDHPGDQSDSPNAERLVRCTEATRYLDTQQSRIWEALAARGRLEETLLVGTSDHGESFDPTRPLRPVNYYDSVLTVPLWVHLPHSLVAGAPALAAQLLTNRQAPVNNIDLFPTVLDVWGQPAEVTRPALAGMSLLRPVPADRVMVATSCSSIYEAASDGFALYHGHWKWLIDELVGNSLFDTSADPDETTCQLATAPPEERAAFLREIPRHPRPWRILKSLAPKLAAEATPAN